MQLTSELQSTLRDNLSISDFIDKINKIADNLALAGSPVSDDELVTIIMKNVGPVYEVTVSSAQARDTPISFDDLVALLLNAEQRFQFQAMHSSNSDINPTALYSSKNSHQFNRGRGNTSRGGSSRGRGTTTARGSNSPARGFSKSGSSNISRPICQICDRAGHTAIDCYNRMNHAFEGRIPTQKLSAMAASSSLNSSGSTWYTDTGASNHITADLGNLAINDEYHGKETVVVGNGAGLQIKHIGSNQFHTQSTSFKFNNILHCPSVTTNLLSVNQFTKDNNCYFVFLPDCFFVKDLKSRRTLFQGMSKNAIYPFQFQGRQPVAFVGVRVAAQVWHSRLGHPSSAVLSRLVSNKIVPTIGSNCSSFCNSCQLAKSSKLPFSLSNSITTTPLALIHSDVWTSPVENNKGIKYYVVFIDDYSRYSWIYPMKFKHEVFDNFKQFKSLVENAFSTKIKSFQSDGGGEYTKRVFQNFLTTHGISFRSSCPDHPEQNGIAERKHRHIVETGLALLAQSNIPSSFWVEAFQTAIFLINRLPTHVLNNISPYEKLFSKSPAYNFF